MAYFALKLHPPRPAFPSDATEAELAASRTAIAMGPAVTAGLGFRYDILPMPSLLLRANG